jgi:nucleoside-diphosphate-sugar epimerase
MRSNDGRVIPAFVTQALAGEALTVFGEGAQTRSFCFVSDLIEGFIRLIESDYQLPVNLGNPIERSVLDLATRINSLVGNAAGVIHKPMPIDDPSRRRPDISLAKAELGWEPAVSFEDGLATTIRWFEAN